MEANSQHFLDLIRRSHRGRFKIYIGMIAGVGKTFRMLQDAHEMLRCGTDVRIGYVETHGRPDTEKALKGLPVIPRKKVFYKGKEIEEMGVPVTERIIISKKAHLILPTHRILDAASESAMGKGKIGSTLKGIGPTYMDKTGRNGLRIGDTLAENFLERFNTLKEKHIQRLKQYDFQYNAEEHEAEWLDAIKYLKKFKIVDGEYEINEILKTKRVLAEGAQGSMLDVDFGSYPFVTSSSTMCAGACTGLGIAPSKIGKVIGIFKAYCTRVGSGPFPTELLDQVGEELRQKGFEFGATTGRPRRTGWLDLPALKYAIMIDGVTELIMMKADVLDTFDTIKVAVGYKVNGKKSDRVPYDTYATIEPVYKEFKGWKCDLTGVRKREELPANFLKYIAFIEKELGVPVKMVSLGPDRKQTIKL